VCIIVCCVKQKNPPHNYISTAVKSSFIVCHRQSISHFVTKCVSSHLIYFYKHLTLKKTKENVSIFGFCGFFPQIWRQITFIEWFVRDIYFTHCLWYIFFVLFCFLRYLFIYWIFVILLFYFVLFWHWKVYRSSKFYLFIPKNYLFF